MVCCSCFRVLSVRKAARKAVCDSKSEASRRSFCLLYTSRLETYVIAGERGSGVICLNGAAARKVVVGDTVIIIAYALMTPEEAAGFEPKVVMVDENNRPVNVRGTEKEREIG